MKGTEESGTNVPVHFYKMSGHGNDFILIDNRDGNPPLNWNAAAREWCSRRTSIGADGILLIGWDSDSDFSLRIFNADGSEAEMCGNGARCAAWYAVDRGIAGEVMTFRTLAGEIRARVEGLQAAIRLTDPTLSKDAVSLSLGEEVLEAYSVNTGVPHAVIFRDDLSAMSSEELHRLGRRIRFHEAFAPAGTNVDFVEVAGPGLIRARTYERGVEGETLACGTGAAASAVASVAQGKIDGPPVAVDMPGGRLFIDFTGKGEQINDLWLKGDVKPLFRGEILPLKG